MELPLDIWRIILSKTSSINDCKNLYNAFSESTKRILFVDYQEQSDKLYSPIGIAIQNKAVIFINNEFEYFLIFHCPINVIRFRPNSEEIVCGCSNGYIYFCIDGKIVREIRASSYGIGLIEFSQDGKYMATIPKNQNHIRIWNLEKDVLSYCPFTLICEDKDYILGSNFKIKFHPNDTKILVTSNWMKNSALPFIKYIHATFDFVKKEERYFSGLHSLVDFGNDKLLEYQQFIGIPGVLEEHKPISEFIQYEHMIYYITRMLWNNYLYSYNTKTHEKKELNIEKGDYCKLNITKNGKKLIFYHYGCGIIVFNLLKNEIEKTFEELNLDENLYFSDNYSLRISDFCVK